MGHARFPPGHRALAGQHRHDSPPPNAHGAERARAGSRQLRGSVTNGILPSIASVHRTEDGSSSCDASVVAVGVNAAETTTIFGDDGNGDGDDGEEEDSGEGDDNDGDDADAGPGVTDVFMKDAATTDAVDVDDVFLPLSTDEHSLT